MRKSEREQFRDLVELHGSAIMGMLRRLCRNQSDADDLFQETAVRVWRNFSKMPRIRNPRSWLMTITYRVFIDFHSRKKTVSELQDIPEKSLNSAEMIAEKKEASEYLQDAINQLSEPLRQVIVLHYTTGLTLKETAKVLEISQGTVKSRLNSALLKLRKSL